MSNMSDGGPGSIAPNDCKVVNLRNMVTTENAKAKALSDDRVAEEYKRVSSGDLPMKDICSTLKALSSCPDNIEPLRQAYFDHLIKTRNQLAEKRKAWLAQVCCLGSFASLNFADKLPPTGYAIQAGSQAAHTPHRSGKPP
jgi:hypothetical protein